MVVARRALTTTKKQVSTSKKNFKKKMGTLKETLASNRTSVDTTKTILRDYCAQWEMSPTTTSCDESTISSSSESSTS